MPFLNPEQVASQAWPPNVPRQPATIRPSSCGTLTTQAFHASHVETSRSPPRAPDDTATRATNNPIPRLAPAARQVHVESLIGPGLQLKKASARQQLPLPTPLRFERGLPVWPPPSGAPRSLREPANYSITRSASQAHRPPLAHPLPQATTTIAKEASTERIPRLHLNTQQVLATMTPEPSSLPDQHPILPPLQPSTLQPKHSTPPDPAPRRTQLRIRETKPKRLGREVQEAADRADALRASGLWRKAR